MLSGRGRPGGGGVDCDRNAGGSKGAPARQTPPFYWEMLRGKLCEINVFSLQPLRALLDFKRDARAFFQGAISARCDRRKMDEDIFAILALDEAESFCCVEPLYGACFFHVSPSKCALTPNVSIEVGTAEQFGSLPGRFK